MNQPKTVFNEDDDDIGVLIYQHAKREEEKSAAALSEKTVVPCRQSARIKQVGASTKSKPSTLETSEAGPSDSLYDRDVPQLYKLNPQLEKWVTKQRGLFKSKSLPENRIAKMDQIGFAWKINKQDAWMERYKELVEYKQEFGNCQVPRSYRTKPKLANWVHKQRQVYKDKSLSEDCIKKLHQIGFTWKSNFEHSRDDKAWLTRYNELVEYKREFGNCHVPRRYKLNPGLGRWAAHQRHQFKKKSLSKDRIAKLNHIGFAWEINREMEGPWLKRYNELVEFKREVGHCYVPQRYKLNPRLGYWVMNQRQYYKVKSLTEDRITKLNQIGFVWKV